MPVTRSRDLTFVAAAIAFVAIITIAGAFLAPEATNDLPQGSSFSRAPAGTAAAVLDPPVDRIHGQPFGRAAAVGDRDTFVDGPDHRGSR